MHPTHGTEQRSIPGPHEVPADAVPRPVGRDDYRVYFANGGGQVTTITVRAFSHDEARQCAEHEMFQMRDDHIWTVIGTSEL